MPSTREIRRRIRSVKNIAQVTRTMQMVASSKMRRAQERVQQSRPYSEQLRALVSRLARVTGEDVGGEIALLKQRPVRRIGFVMITPDRGLSGALPSNVNRKAATSAIEEQNHFAQQGERPAVDYVVVGRKGRDFVIRNQLHMIAEFTNYGDRPALTDATAIAQVAMDAFLKGEVDVFYLVYPKFIPRYVDVQVYQALLETIASFYSAQMVAMKSATDNANDLVQDLTLTYNKARQANITTEILEVVGGAQGL